MDFGGTQELTDDQLLQRLREFGDTNYKAVTAKNRQILEKKLNHHLARQFKKEKEANAKTNKASKSPKRGRPPARSSFANIAISKVFDSAPEFSDSDIDRSPSRSRRSSRRHLQTVETNTSYNLDETAEPLSAPYSSAAATSSQHDRSRRSFGANTSYHLDETAFEEPSEESQTSSEGVPLYPSSVGIASPRASTTSGQIEINRQQRDSLAEAQTKHLNVRQRRIYSAQNNVPVPSGYANQSYINDVNCHPRRSTVISAESPRHQGRNQTSRHHQESSSLTSILSKPKTQPQKPVQNQVSSAKKNHAKSRGFFTWSRVLNIFCILLLLVFVSGVVYFNRPCVGEHCATFTKVEDRLKTIAKMAAVVNGNFQCGYNNSPFLRIIDMTFDPDPISVLKFGLEKEKDKLMFKILDDSEDLIENSEELRRASKVQSSVPVKSLSCRVRQSFAAVTSALMYLLLGIFGLIGLLITVKVYLNESQKESKIIDELVNGILDIVKAQAQKNPPYIPIAHVRDSLLSSSSSNHSMKLTPLSPTRSAGVSMGQIGGRGLRRWERAVIQLGKRESRLRTENQIIKGEEHLVWRWVAMGEGGLTSYHSTSKQRSFKAKCIDRSRSPSAERITQTSSATTTGTSNSEPESIDPGSRAGILRDSPVRHTARPLSRDTHNGSGSSLESQGRARSRSDSRGRKSIRLGPGSGWSNYERSCIEIIPPTNCLKLKDLAIESTGNVGLESAKQSVIERIQRHNFQVYSVDCDHRSEELAVYICCKDKPQAADIYRLFYEQKYNGEKVQVKFLSVDKYLARFPYLKPVVMDKV